MGQFGGKDVVGIRGHPIFRATSPLSRGRLRSKGHGRLSIHNGADLETIETIFRIIVDSEAKAMEDCRYTMVPIWKRLRLFFA